MKLIHLTILVVLLGFLSVVYLPSETVAETSFDAIKTVQAKIPSDKKNRMWYVGKWTQEKIDENKWKVSVSDAVWKVSLGEDLCSENGDYVSMCSENGTAKRYSDIGFCKPSYICDNKKVNISDINITKELGQIDLSNLSYLQEKVDGWKCTIVKNIPEIVRRAIFSQSSEFERVNSDATSSDTIKDTAKRHGLPEKAAKAIYYEGVFKRW